MREMGRGRKVIFHHLGCTLYCMRMYLCVGPIYFGLCADPICRDLAVGDATESSRYTHPSLASPCLRAYCQLQYYGSNWVWLPHAFGDLLQPLRAPCNVCSKPSHCTDPHLFMTFPACTASLRCDHIPLAAHHQHLSDVPADNRRRVQSSHMVTEVTRSQQSSWQQRWVCMWLS